MSWPIGNIKEWRRMRALKAEAGDYLYCSWLYPIPENASRKEQLGRLAELGMIGSNYGRTQPVMKVLGRIGDNDAVEILVDFACREWGYSRRETAQDCIRGIRNRKAAPALLKALKCNNEDTRACAARALLRMSNKAMLPELIEGLAVGGEWARSELVNCFVEIGIPALKPLFLAAKSKDYANARKEIAEAVRQINERMKRRRNDFGIVERKTQRKNRKEMEQMAFGPRNMPSRDWAQGRLGKMMVGR